MYLDMFFGEVGGMKLEIGDLDLLLTHKITFYLPIERNLLN